ncbi:hypothetical protein PSEUBRA_002524 [Kalmanozyma brasiliensis GHG001]|uniref:Uncharacterized protein n=1 Tax=Kalmanozyma brasiliensis (strain GHG001) TaxID=1365824 RepID=V5EAM3_KALBG|nr:uncharacterized protein PSEUBRA_002524 [Kalmanozyma brasiliensis GHG001]EST07451.1 hypothetical protein PSEUBRA_002524 [Kalmanozyma brasiliensis GHG001]
MVVQRTPPPVRRSPRKEAAAVTQAPFSSQPPLSSQAQKIANTIASTPSASSRAEPFTPVPHNAASDFPSLDQMAAVSKEQRSVTRPTANRAAFAASFPASSSNTVPSSLPRPTAQLRSTQLINDENNHDQRSRAARSSLTNGAIQRVRQQAGDVTPLGVSQARAARQAQASSQANQSLIADDSGDSTAQLVPGRRDINPVLADIDVENPQMPGLASTAAPTASTPAVNNTAAFTTDAAADASTASQTSVFGTAIRRNGVDQPIGGAKAGTAYDFSKYLDGELDPFNRASRANVRRESRPLPAAQQQNVGASDEDADSSGDTTARGALAAAATTATVAPIESTPFFNRVKAAAAPTPRMSPHASPSVSSRKLAHLSSLTNGHSTPSAVNAGPSALGDASTVSLASHNRFDPSARADRLQTMELGELRKKATALSRDLTAAHDALASAKEESEGWASECTGLQEQLSTLKASHQTAIARETRARTELQVRLSQYKIEADDRAWKLLSQRRQACLVEVALQHAKNEVTYHEGRYHATESELEGQKDELRIRLMLERKRADLLSLHVKAALRDSARMKKRLGVKSAALLELQAENESLAEQLEEARQSRGTAGRSGDSNAAAKLKQQLKDAQAEIETLNERDAMMAETRKTWKAERKQLLAQVEQLSSSSAPAPAPVAAKVSALKAAKSLVATQMLPPSSPVYAKQKSRQPMQGASELEPPSEDEMDRRAPPAARKPLAAKSSAPLVPFAQLPSKNATAAVKKTTKPTVAAPKPKSSKNWRDEVAITDSSEEDSDSDAGARRRSKPAKTGLKKSVPKPTVGGKKTKPSMPIEYDDQTADPSATPIIRTKRAAAPAESDDDSAGPPDSSLLATKFGRDRTNTLPTKPKPSTLKANLALASQNAAAAAGGKKKKRKLLGGGAGAMQWGASDAAGLAPNFDIPLELSPIKGGGKTAGNGGPAAFMAGFGRNPFA